MVRRRLDGGKIGEIAEALQVSEKSDGVASTVNMGGRVYASNLRRHTPSGRAYGLSEDVGGIIAMSFVGVIYDYVGPVFSVLSLSMVLLSGAIFSIFAVKTNERAATARKCVS